jgi:hypothetical protein
MSTCYSTLPAHHQAEAAAYVDSGRRPSPLLLAVLDNNLTSTLNHLPAELGAEERLALLAALATWALLEAPAVARGGVVMTDAWMQSGGRIGRAAARQAEVAALQAHETARAACTNGTPRLRVVGSSEEAVAYTAGAYSFCRIADAVGRLGPLRPL